MLYFAIAVSPLYGCTKGDGISSDLQTVYSTYVVPLGGLTWDAFSGVSATPVAISVAILALPRAVGGRSTRLLRDGSAILSSQYDSECLAKRETVLVDE